MSAVLAVLAIVTAMLAGQATAADSVDGPGGAGDRLAAAAAPGTPAPIRPLPACEQLQDPPTGACPLKSPHLTVSSSGSLDGSGSVLFTITPSIPPCGSFDYATRTFSQPLCYTQIAVVNLGSNFLAPPRCEYLDDATGLLEPCLVPYQDSFDGWGDVLSVSGDWIYRNGLNIFGCASVSQFNLYPNGGPPGSGQTWPELAALTGECNLSMARTPDNLMGASWAVISGVLEVARPGNGGTIFEPAVAETYVRINGTLSPFAEVDPDPDPETPFTDVPDTSFARDDIALLYELGITKGVSATEYGPAQEVTREQMAAFLARMWEALGNDCPDGENPFGDISTSSYAHDAAACIFELGITTGVSATRYDPSGKVTREQMAAFLARMWRALGNSCPDGGDPFTDVSAGSFAKADIACIYRLGITTGTSATSYGPTGNVTREQMAAFLGRLYRAQTT